ncbi:MAG: hydrogenase expression/formation protein HypE [bacterium]|jgi:hydrogenase expression/formation protein HypE
MTETQAQVVLLAHGDGGALTRELVEKVFLRHFANPALKEQGDAAELPKKLGRLALTTDSFVVNPLFFPGGDIGKLAVYGTVNDLAVSGARPEYLAASFLLEEGLELSVLNRVTASMADACREAEVEIVAGDTKVVEREHLDQLFITTTGVGWLAEDSELGYRQIRPGDLVLVNGNLGDHGLAIIMSRYGLDLNEQIKSDCAPLNHIIHQLLTSCHGIRFMRDLTRGGLATAVKEVALAASVDIWLVEEALPVARAVRAGADVLGLDPLYLANEGKFLAIVAREEAEHALTVLKEHRLGRAAAVIGEVREGRGNAYLKTALGGTKFLDLMAGAPLPRIC